MVLFPSYVSQVTFSATLCPSLVPYSHSPPWPQPTECPRGNSPHNLPTPPVSSSLTPWRTWILALFFSSCLATLCFLAHPDRAQTQTRARLDAMGAEETVQTLSLRKLKHAEVHFLMFSMMTTVVPLKGRAERQRGENITFFFFLLIFGCPALPVPQVWV